MPKNYFRIDQALDNTIMRIIEDSILCNPTIAKDDKDAVITHLCYSLPYEDANAQRYTYHTAYKSLDEKQIAQQQAAPELLDALKNAVARMEENHPPKAKRGDLNATFKNAKFYRDLEAARAAILKAEG